MALEELHDLKEVWSELSKVWEQIDQMKEQPWVSVQPRKVLKTNLNAAVPAALVWFKYCSNLFVFCVRSFAKVWTLF